jgi:hypothetical protein
MSVPDVSFNPLGYMGTNQYTNPVTLPVALRAPGSSDVYPVNTTWPYNDAGTITLYTSLGGGTWTTSSSAYATTSSPGLVQLATNAEAVTGSNTLHAIVPSSLTARLAAPGAIGGTTPAAGHFTSVDATTTVTAGTGITATTGSIKATAGQVIAGGDVAGVASTTSLTNSESTTISTGVGSVKMSTTNAANNAAWIKIYIGTVAYWIPAWTTNAP